jgi:hypothetical protein
MKKTIFFVLIMVFSLSASTAFADKKDPKTSPDNLAVPGKTENKLSEEEISRLTRRVEEIRDMDKTEMTGKEKRELRKELKETKENVRRSDGTVVIGVSTLLLLIIILILIFWSLMLTLRSSMVEKLNAVLPLVKGESNTKAEPGKFQLKH